MIETSYAGSATLEIQVEWAKSNPSCKLELARFLGEDAPDGQTNKHLATSDRHRGGGTHQTERLANIDMVGA